MMYFVICNDGDTTVEMLDKKTLEKRLAEGYYGDVEFLTYEQHRASDEAARDTKYWGSAILIIEGHVVVPKPKEVVKEWEV